MDRYEFRPPLDEGAPRAAPPKRRRRRNLSSTITNIMTKLIALTILVLLILVMVLPGWKPYRDNLLEYLVAGLEYYQEDPEYSEFMVERVMKLNSEGGNIEYTLSIPVPKDTDINDNEIQRVYKFETTISDKKATLTKTDDLYYYKGEISGKTTLTVSIIYHVKGFTVDWDIGAHNSGKIEDIPENYTQKYTIDRWEVFEEDGTTYRDVDEDGETPDYRFEPTNPLLKSIAEDLVGDETNVYMMAFKIYKAINQDGITITHDNGNKTTFGKGGFAYPTPEQSEEDRLRYFGKPKPAYVTLGDGYGDCDDQAILFLTLCRAVGIPGWLESGALFNEWSVPQAWEGHGWGKIMIPMKNGDMEEAAVDPVNNLFLKRDANRYSDWEDPGGGPKKNAGDIPDLPLDIESYYTSWTYRTESSGVEISFEDEYITHFYNSYKSNLEIKV